MDFRVLHYPKAECEPFIVWVKTIEEANELSDTLTAYDRFQYENGIKLNYTSKTLIEVWKKGEWVEWTEDESEIRDIDESFYLFGTS